MGPRAPVARGLVWEKAKGLGPVRVAPHGDPVVWLEGAIEVFGGWLGWDIDALVERAQTIDGLPFARVEEVLAFKPFYGRPKDLAHARLIEEYLRGAPGDPGTRTCESLSGAESRREPLPKDRVDNGFLGSVPDQERARMGVLTSDRRRVDPRRLRRGAVPRSSAPAPARSPSPAATRAAPRSPPLRRRPPAPGCGRAR